MFGVMKLSLNKKRVTLFIETRNGAAFCRPGRRKRLQALFILANKESNEVSS